MMGGMELFKVTITPEQQAATEQRVAKAWAPFLNAMRAAAPVMTAAANEAGAAIRRAVAPAARSQQ